MNGIDYAEWSPTADPFLTTDGYMQYTAETMAAGKAACKAALQKVGGGGPFARFAGAAQRVFVHRMLELWVPIARRRARQRCRRWVPALGFNPYLTMPSSWTACLVSVCFGLLNTFGIFNHAATGARPARQPQRRPLQGFIGQLGFQRALNLLSLGISIFFFCLITS